MAMIVVLRLKKFLYFSKKKNLIFCEMEPPKKSFLYFKREFPIFWEISSDFLGNENSSRILIKHKTLIFFLDFCFIFQKETCKAQKNKKFSPQFRTTAD